MKKTLSFLVTLTMLTTILVSTMTTQTSAVEGYVNPTATALKTTTAITVDGNIAEWDRVPSNYFNYQDFTGVNTGDTTTASTDSYFEILYDANNIYIAAVIKDATLETQDTNPGRDWFKVAVDLDGVSTDIAMDLNTRAFTVSTLAGDGWFPKDGVVPFNWEGYSSGTNGSAFKTGDMKIVNNAGFSYVECVYELNDNLKSRLVSGTKIGVGVKYENYLINASDHDPVNFRYLWGDDNYVFNDDGGTKLGTVTLGAERASATVSSVMAKKATGEIIIDADLGEWANVGKTNMGYYDYSGVDNGATFNAPDASYFQVVYDATKIYFAAAIPDTELQTTDGAPGRDWLKMVFDLDGLADVHVDSNTRALTIATIAGDGWFPQDGSFPFNWEGYASAENGHAFKNGTMKILWKSGVTYVEASFDVNDNLTNRLVAGSKFGFGVKYEDYLVAHNDQNPTNRRYLWGDNDYMFLNDISKFGLMELSAEEVSLEQPIIVGDPVILDSTEGIPSNNDIVVETNGDRSVSWNALSGAASYKVNLFARFEAIDGTSHFYLETKDVTTTEATFAYLDEDTDYTYQVVAYDDQGNVMGVYGAVDFSTALALATPTPTPTNVVATPTTATEETDNVNTGDSIYLISMIALLSFLAMIIIAKRKKDAVK